MPEAENAFAPSLCNRIDKNTQGLVIAAKNAEALRIMNEKVKERGQACRSGGVRRDLAFIQTNNTSIHSFFLSFIQDEGFTLFHSQKIQRRQKQTLTGNGDMSLFFWNSGSREGQGR